MHFDVVSEHGNGETWLIVDRLQESPAPQPTSTLLETWLELTNNPNKAPTLRSHVDAQTLLEIGAISLPVDITDFDPNQLIDFTLFDHKKTVEDQLKAYLENIWKPWAEEEKRRRRTITLYAKLFTLRQQLEGAIVDAQLELVWGAGIAVWNISGSQVSYPLVSRLVELSLNEATMAMEIRPRDVEPKIELDVYAAANNPGIIGLEKAAKEFFSNTNLAFSPFDRSTFEPLLRSSVTHLGTIPDMPMGIYWPNQTAAEDRSLPKPEEELKVTDTWVIFARPRSANLFIQDLERFKLKLVGDEDFALPKAVTALVTNPATTNDFITLPPFRGVSMVHGSGGTNGFGGQAPQDLFFPHPFNDEQVRIVQLLEVSDGVVVQGPPGTGKTHTIANVICHYLALGKRVLVTSMKDPALSVLREKLPPEIQPLAISLLTSEQAGMKQFEHAISKIAAEVQAIDRISLAREIVQIEGAIEACHAKLAKIDSQISEWAVKNLSRVDLDGEMIEPKDAANEVAGSTQETGWLDDPITVGPEYRPRFADADIARLREARRELGRDIDYLGCTLPLISAFPESRELLQVHRDLSRHAELQVRVDSGEVPPLADSSKATFQAAQHLSAQISNLKLLRQTVQNSGASWTATMLARLRTKTADTAFELLDSLGAELELAISARTRFQGAGAVEPRDGIDDQNEVLVAAIRRCADGKHPFGLSGVVGKGAEKTCLKAIRVDSSVPIGQQDWLHILNFVLHRQTLRKLIGRWNSLAEEFQLPLFPAQPSQAITINEHFGLYQKLTAIVALENEISHAARLLLTNWARGKFICHDDSVLDEAECIMLHHLTQNRLAETWAVKERFQQVLAGSDGRITQEIREFLEGMLGHPAIPDVEIQSQWSALMEGLRHIQNIKPHLDTVDEVTRLISESGAPSWASRLRTEPVSSTTDSLLPDNWRKAWRVKRLSSYLESTDGRAELKRLFKLRSETETDLARSYQEAVTKRTWLKLEERTNHSVKAALQAYLEAIRRIGRRGTGRRVPLYRQQAREATAVASPAIPCWIMPHYRVSESLPSEFGCFDLVVIDEASQSDLSALPAILRAKKALVVGDDKQVSPDGAFIDTQSIQSLVNRFLINQFPLFRAQMTPDRSIYDLFKVVFANSAVMLKEHFRCVAPIIEYSKREVYKHELKPLRIPKASERLDPPLVDVIVEDGYRKGDVNLGEARFIVEEIQSIVQDSCMAGRSIGVVSLLGDKQTLKIWEMLNDDELDENGKPLGLPPDIIDKHKITCGDARTFQGKERDIMFLTMIVSKGNATALSRDTFVQRFNVAASRARDRMYLVRSVTPDDLSHADSLRRNLIAHFAAPFAQDEARVENLRVLCESDFEREVYDLLTDRGYRVIPQVQFGGNAGGSHTFRIDLVVEGHLDNRLAVECDGDRFHGPDRWDDDMRRQRILERAGWRFWRCFASAFVMNRQEVIADLLKTLEDFGIEPIGAEGVSWSLHTSQRRYTAFPMATPNGERPQSGESGQSDLFPASP